MEEVKEWLAKDGMGPTLSKTSKGSEAPLLSITRMLGQIRKPFQTQRERQWIVWHLARLTSYTLPIGEGAKLKEL